MVKKIFLLIFCFKLCSAFNSEDVVFKMPDLTIDFDTKDGNYHLEAFKLQSNDDILSSKKESDYSKLSWFSLGHPVLVNNYLNSSSLVESRNKATTAKLFRFSPEGFHIFVEMLTNEQKKLFVNEVYSKYNVSIKSKQIVRLIPEKFSCSLVIFDKSQRNKVHLKGYARNLREYPLRVDFFYSQFNRERVVFEERINMMKFDDHDEFSFDCKFETNGKKSRSNVLKIDSDKIKSLNLIEDIFGKMSETVYLTRNQMNKLSTKMYNSLKIEQVYEISEHQFNEKFVSNLIELVGESSFESVDFDLALNSLSKYSFDKKQDFKLDLLNEEMNKIFKIQNDVNSNSHIVVNTDLNNKTHVFIDTLFDAKSTSEFVQSRENDWQNKILNLEDQLYELNTFSQHDIEWKIDEENNKIVPQSLKVVLFKKSLFRKTPLIFNRIFTLFNDAEFKQEFTLYVKNSLPEPGYLFDEFKQKYSFKKGMIQIVDANVLKNYFDTEGIGFNEYLGWHICNGRSNTPDLRGKFVVGFDATNLDYSNVGNAGGSDHIQLTIEQIPSHTHLDSGHRHSLNLSTSQNGIHNHNYWDTFWSESSRFLDHSYYSDNGVSIGSSVKADTDNVGWDKRRSSFDSGEHVHTINGDSSPAQAILSHTGGNQSFDNRPSYYVLVYIIYQGTD